MKKKLLSIHRPKKNKFLNIEMFGHYLAGLIDGDGHISKLGHIVIFFNLSDVRNAHQLRSRLKYGKIRSVKNKKAVNLIISNKKGILLVACLIKNKLKHLSKINQYNNRLVKLFNIEKTSLDNTINWNTPWFSGFFDADGYFKIYLLNRKNRINLEVRLLAQIDQKAKVLLSQIKSKFGGYLGYRKSQNTYYYSSVSFNAMFKLLTFFDTFNLQYYRTYLKYTILRKSYVIVQNNEHLKNSGQLKLEKYLKKLNKLVLKRL